MNNYPLRDPNPEPTLAAMWTSRRVTGGYDRFGNIDAKENRCHNCQCERPLNKCTHVWLVKAWWYADTMYIRKMGGLQAVWNNTELNQEYNRIYRMRIAAAAYGNKAGIKLNDELIKLAPTIMLCDVCYRKHYMACAPPIVGRAVCVEVATGMAVNHETLKPL